MAKTKLPIWDQRMIMLMEHCLESGIEETQASFLNGIEVSQNVLSQIRDRKSSFRNKHILAAAKKYQIDINWIFGLSDSMKRSRSKDPLQNLKDAVKEIETEIKHRK